MTLLCSQQEKAENRKSATLLRFIRELKGTPPPQKKGKNWRDSQIQRIPAHREKQLLESVTGRNT